MYRQQQNESEALRRAQENLNKQNSTPKQEKTEPEVEGMDVE